MIGSSGNSSGSCNENDSLQELISTQRELQSLALVWKEAREERRCCIMIAQEQAIALDQYAASIGELESAHAGAAPLRQTPGRARSAHGPRLGNGRPISGSDFRCKYKRHSLQIECSISIHIPEGPLLENMSKVIIRWHQHITQIQRTLELSSRNIIGVKSDGIKKITLHCFTSPTMPLGPDSACEHEQHEFEFDDGETARRCSEGMERVAEAVLPCARGERILFVVNPVSGHRMGQQLFDRVIKLFRLAKVETSQLFTRRGGHAEEYIGKLGEADMARTRGIVCIGGDGTVCEVINAVMLRSQREPGLLDRLALGTVPAGSECALAKMLGYTGPVAAAYQILKGHRRLPIDLLHVSQLEAGGALCKEMYAICGMGWGIAGKIASESEAMRAHFGPARYLVSGLKSFIFLQGFRGRLEIEGFEVLHDGPPGPAGPCEPCRFAGECGVCSRARLAARDMVATPRKAQLTTHYIDGPFVVVGMLKSEKALAPYVHVADGYVDVVAVPEETRLDLVKRSTRILTRDKLVELYWKATRVKLIPESLDDKINVDGEVLDGRETILRVLPSAITFYVAYEP